ncbi:MAG TPA: hypothetical protein VMT51_03750 [Dongiaceae bacterium]|nr:hypothetical protein [Dongiaceae bacterium]
MSQELNITKVEVTATTVSLEFSAEIANLGLTQADFDFQVLRVATGAQSQLNVNSQPQVTSPSSLSFAIVTGQQLSAGDTVAVTFHPGAHAAPAMHKMNLEAPAHPRPGVAQMKSTPSAGDNGQAIMHDLGVTASSFEDAVTFPFLTEEVGMPPGPLGGGGGGYGGGGYGGGAGGGLTRGSLGQSASQAIGEVLGWKVNSTDAAGFVGALTQSFTLSEVEGHTEAKWVPRSYAVQTDLAGGITGAQASLLFRMKEAVDQSLPLIEGLTPLRRDPDWEFITAAKAVIKSQLTELVNELSLPGSLRVARVDQIFRILFEPPLARTSATFDSETETVEFAPGTPTPQVTSTTQVAGGKPPAAVMVPHVQIAGRPIETDPDYVGGQIGELRVQLGLRTRPYHDAQNVLIEEGNLVNTVDDETDQTNYRMVVDYLTSIWISWLNNRQFFELPVDKGVQPFFGTQLVLISRALSTVTEKVNELRFALDSVFIGQSERQALELHFTERIKLLGGEEEIVPSRAMFLEDLLNWVYSFSTDEGPRLIQSAGRYGVRDSFLPVAKTLHILVEASKSANGGTVRGFKTARVRRAVEELSRQLKFLRDMAKPIRSPMKLAGRGTAATN